MDFVAGRLSDGRPFRLLTLVDNFSRISPAIEVDFSLTGQRVAEVLERLKLSVGLPKIIKVDNGSEFNSRVMDAWAHHNAVKLNRNLQHWDTHAAFKFSAPTNFSNAASTSDV